MMKMRIQIRASSIDGAGSAIPIDESSDDLHY